MKVIKITLITSTVIEHNCDENFIQNLLNTDKVVYYQLNNCVLICSSYTNIEKCFSLKMFPQQLVMANAILVGGTIGNYKSVPFEANSIRSDVYFLHDKSIVTKENKRLKDISILNK